MVPLLIFLLLFFTAFEGNSSVETFGYLTAQRGGSVTIPCHYDQKYKHHVKYWCRGESWTFCTTVVRTDSPQRRGEVSITDHPDQLIFTVTMRNLQEKDSDLYWCAVEIGGLGIVDDRKSISIKVPAGVQGVRTESWLSAQRGESVTIPCHYDQKYKHHVKYWCRGESWTFCRTVVRTNSPQGEGEVFITDHPDQLLFNVTMRNLQEKHSDTYWCAVEVNRGPDDGAFLPIKVLEEDCGVKRKRKKRGALKSEDTLHWSPSKWP
ncbi:polymeric immunoglobulin receptor-like [Arapaima gigas]